MIQTWKTNQTGVLDLLAKEWAARAVGFEYSVFRVTEISRLGKLRHMTPVWAVFDCGEIYRLYVDEDTAREAAKKLIANFRDEDRLYAVLDAVHKTHNITVLIEGGAQGADAKALSWAVRNGIHVETYEANWREYGKAAGMIRNRQMLVEGEPDIVYAFTSKPLSESKGTHGMVKMARKAGVRTIVVGQDDSEYVIAEAELF